MNSKVGPNILISSIKVVLTLPLINPTFAPVPINPEITILSNIWANGRKEMWHENSSRGIEEAYIHVSKTHIKFLWQSMTPFGFPVVPLV